LIRYLPTALEAAGALLIIIAGWLIVPPLGLALAGAAALAAAYALERPNDRTE
jgi:hypothetical protein